MQKCTNLYSEIEQAKEEDLEDEDWDMQDESAMDEQDDCFEPEEEFGGDEEILNLQNNLPFDLQEYLKIRNEIEPSLF